jgi:AraC-like DNA-binding protein
LPVPPPGHGSSEQHGTAYTIRAEAALRAVVLVADFRASQRVLDLGAVSVWPTTFQPVCFRRSSKLIRQSDPEGLHVSLPLSGALRTVRGEEEAEYGPDSLCVVDTSRTVDVHGGDGSLPHTGVGLEVPKALLPLPRNRLDHVTGLRLSVQEGFGALLRQLLTQLARGTDAYLPADGPRLGSVVVDLLSALFAQALEAESSLPPETRQETLVLRIRAFVRDHLHDPNLTPGAIAAANHISRSYLYRLFEHEEESIAAWIRGQRLEGARRDLAEPALGTTPIHAIAARWGFPRAADFTRAFRSAYGIPPRDYRQGAQGLPD